MERRMVGGAKDEGEGEGSGKAASAKTPRMLSQLAGYNKPPLPSKNAATSEASAADVYSARVEDSSTCRLREPGNRREARFAREANVEANASEAKTTRRPNRWLQEIADYNKPPINSSERFSSESPEVKATARSAKFPSQSTHLLRDTAYHSQDRNSSQSRQPANMAYRPPWWQFSSRTARMPGHEVQRRIDEQAEMDGIRRPKGYTVSFHYNPEVERHHFGRSHPMKPWRLQLTKQLILCYGLDKAMDNYPTAAATRQELCEFHNEDYITFLNTVTPENMDNHRAGIEKYKFGDDCPVFDGLYQYCSLYTGATCSAARNLTSGQSDIAINWSGGLHHAKKSEASGFCYVNDIVLAIREMLRYYQRILYIDIDVHHGDGVEQAFYSTDRVMTLSFHKYDKDYFFPGTGSFDEHGPENNSNPGAHHSLNVPLKDGIDDDEYTSLFQDIFDDCTNHYRPHAIVLQCGADSLGGDRLGKFNLNIKAHGDCVAYVKKYQVPLLILGGGGYTARNVARLWTHETSLLVGAQLSNILPDHIPYRQAFEGPENGEGELYPNLSHIENKRHKNEHDRKYLDKCRRVVREQLRYLVGAPSVAMARQPRDIWQFRAELEKERKERKERRDLERNGNGRDMELG